MSELRTTYFGTLGIAALFLIVAVVLVAVGAVDERVTPLWNPALLAAAGLGPAYGAPRTSLRMLFSGGAALGLLYAAMVLGAEAFGSSAELLGPTRLLAWSVAIGALPPAAAGAFYRLLAWRAGRSSPRVR